LRLVRTPDQDKVLPLHYPFHEISIRQKHVPPDPPINPVTVTGSSISMVPYGAVAEIEGSRFDTCLDTMQ
jgi:hypothetical protein